jgi:hypothetical protein
MVPTYLRRFGRRHWLYDTDLHPGIFLYADLDPYASRYKIFLDPDASR